MKSKIFLMCLAGITAVMVFLTVNNYIVDKKSASLLYFAVLVITWLCIEKGEDK